MESYDEFYMGTLNKELHNLADSYGGEVIEVNDTFFNDVKRNKDIVQIIYKLTMCKIDYYIKFCYEDGNYNLSLNDLLINYPKIECLYSVAYNKKYFDVIDEVEKFFSECDYILLHRKMLYEYYKRLEII